MPNIQHMPRQVKSARERFVVMLMCRLEKRGFVRRHKAPAVLDMRDVMYLIDDPLFVRIYPN